MNDYTKLIVLGVITIVFTPLALWLLAVVQLHCMGLKVRDFRGKWKSVWTISDPDKAESNTDRLEFKQVGPFLWGKAIGPKHEYIIKGTLNADGYFSGSWRDTQKATDWYGTFKFKVQPDGKRMVGKWIGKSNAGVRSGDWILEGD